MDYYDRGNPICSRFGEYLYVPRYKYLSYYSGDCSGLNLLIFAEQICVEELEYDGFPYYRLCQPKNASVKCWTFEELVDYLVVTETNFTCCKFSPSNLVCWIPDEKGYGFDDKEKIGPDGTYWPSESYRSYLGWAVTLPYEAVSEGDFCFNAVNLSRLTERERTHFFSLGFQDSVSLPYKYENGVLTIGFKLPNRPPWIRAYDWWNQEDFLKQGFRSPVPITHYRMDKYKGFNRLAVLDGWHIGWAEAEELPWTYQRHTKILRVKTGVKKEFHGYQKAERLPFRYEKDCLVVVKDLPFYGWRTAVPIEGTLIRDGLRLYAPECLENYHLNFTELKKLKLVKPGQRREGLNPIGYYTSRDSHFSKILFYDAREFGFNC